MGRKRKKRKKARKHKIRKTERCRGKMRKR